MSDTNEVVDRLRTVLIEALGLNLQPEELRSVNRIDELVAFDSVAVLQFITAVEKEFCFTIEPGWLELDRITNLPKLAGYIQTRGLQGAAGAAISGHE